MGSVYPRKNSLWLKFKNEKGAWQCKASGFKTGDEKKAHALLERIENLVREGAKVAHDGPLTVRAWSDTWLQSRRDNNVGTVEDYESRLRDHILPEIGHLRLDAVRVGHIRDMLNKVKKKELAPRTIRHIYFVAHGMFEKAVGGDLLLANPCKLDKDDLPAKVDKNPEWRSQAILTREELESIISDQRVPEWRRMFWGLLFLTGMRFGEAAARRWRHYQPNEKPLGRLTVTTSFNTKKKKEKAPKTNHTRDVPVHPTLAVMLAHWKLGGWARAMGRNPTHEDLIVPYAEEDGFGEHLDLQKMLRRFHWDQEMAGLRSRRQHDTRRTFISLCLSDGARKDILKWVTHSRPNEDQVDDYTTLLWNPLCEEVAKLQIHLRSTEPSEALAVANSAEPAGSPANRATPQATPPKASVKNDNNLGDLGRSTLERETGLENVPLDEPQGSPAQSGPNFGLWWPKSRTVGQAALA